MGISVIDGIGGSGIGDSGIGGAGVSAGLAFSPLSLFANGERGAWYDPDDIATIYQDSLGTIPVTSNSDPVGMVVDKSGTGSDVSQPIDESRPTYPGLSYDGIDDRLTASSFTSSSVSVFMLMKGVSSTDPKCAFGGVNSGSNWFLAVADAGSLSTAVTTWGGSQQFYKNGSLVTLNNRGDADSTFYTGEWCIFEAQLTASPNDSISIGNTGLGGAAYFGDIGETVIVDSITPENRDNLISYLAAKKGIAL